MKPLTMNKKQLYQKLTDFVGNFPLNYQQALRATRQQQTDFLKLRKTKPF
jgi:hypothetical protein